MATEQLDEEMVEVLLGGNVNVKDSKGRIPHYLAEHSPISDPEWSWLLWGQKRYVHPEGEDGLF